MSNLPKYIALCGHPKSGKDTVAEMLTRLAGYRQVDNGLILRQAVPVIFNCDPADPFSQVGKARLVNTPDGQRTVRDLLGTLGDLLEAEFGENVMAWAALNQCAQIEKSEGAERFVLASCRKEEGWSYREAGGVVVQVLRKDVGPSPHAFDRWNKSYVDHVIQNDGSLEDLEAEVQKLISYF